MPRKNLDILAIGNAIVDVIAAADDAFLEARGLAKGAMRLIDAGEAEALYGEMGQAREISGGSAANTVAGIAALGGSAGFVGQVADDQLGRIFAHDITALGIDYATPPRNGDIPTGRCLILVTPDGERTMNTFLGASRYLPESAIDEEQVGSAGILYLEGYLWDAEEPRFAMIRAIEIARDAGRETAFTLSDIFCVERHREGIAELLEKRRLDILFANEAELAALAEEDEIEAAIAAVAPRVETLIVTRSEKGAIGIRGGERSEVAAEPVAGVVDTTGAGDLFAAGFLHGRAQGRGLEDSLRLGAIAAGEIISHYGARPEADLKALVGERL
ncbi:MAG: adenosine kinase [Sphingomonadaceae bacterium]